MSEHSDIPNASSDEQPQADELQKKNDKLFWLQRQIQHLAAFKQTVKDDDSTRKQLEKEMEPYLLEINNILGEVIYTMPDKVQAIEVTLSDKLSAEERYERLDNLRDQMTIGTEYPLPQTIVLPLPYGFYSTSHGSGDRAARANSRMELAAQMIGIRGNYMRPPEEPTLGVQLEPVLFSARYLYIPFHELIEGIRLVPFEEGDIPFTPYIRRIKYDEHEYIPRPGNVLHYALFRGFVGFSDHPAIISHATNLWQRDRKKGLFARGDEITQGFFMIQEEDELTLYEIQHVPEKDRRQDTIDDVLRHKDRLKKQGHLKTYTGKAIIDRLFEIPVEERNY